MTKVVDEVRTQLHEFLQAQLPSQTLRIENLTRIGLGRSRENWAFDGVWSDSGEEVKAPLILRRDPEGGLVKTDRVQEFAVLRALGGSAAAPQALWLDALGRWLTRPSLVMRREAGSCDYRVLNGERPIHERKLLAQRFCDLLAQVHEVKWRNSELASVLTDPGPRAGAKQVDDWVAILRRDELEPYPELELVSQWLRRNAPVSPETVLVHGDFKPGNILLDGLRIVGLLDWELAHLGDPMEDLGWVTQPLRTAEHLITGAWDRADLLGHYERVSGRLVLEESVSWWTVFAGFRTAVMQISGLRSFLEGRIDKPYGPTARVFTTLLEAVRF